MGAPLQKTRDVRRDEWGFTLQELMTVVAILGILIAIAVIVFLALLERWRVEAAASQFAADLRLAHGRATNQLTDWRVVFMPDGSPVSGCSSADYCMIKLSAPYDGGDSTPTMDSETPPAPRELPEGTKMKEVTFDPDCSGGDRGAVAPPSSCGGTRTLVRRDVHLGYVAHKDRFPCVLAGQRKSLATRWWRCWWRSSSLPSLSS